MSSDSATLESAPASTPSPDAVRHPGSWLARRVIATLGQLEQGEIELTTPDGHAALVGRPAADGLQANVHITDPRFYREVAFGGSLGGAEAYLAGYWTTDDLTAVLRVFCRNLTGFSGIDRGPARWATWLAAWGHRFAANTRRGSRRNIAAHYDLSNEFFQLFLDPTLLYSSALFEHAGQSLEEASRAKLDRVCRRLNLQPGDRVLEIGTGWGAFALHAAREYGCHVTTTTISRNQHRLAAQRFRESGVKDRITLLELDYRDLRGEFDHIASIEMIEAVGHDFLPTYFQTCDRLLKAGGRLAIQAIVMPEQRYESYRRSADFIQKYVFPGGHLPSIAAMQQAVAQGTRLQLVDSLQFAESYARTLREWRTRFHARRDDVRRFGFDERFLRLWEFYLCYCEAAFLERAVGVGQFVWEKTKY